MRVSNAVKAKRILAGITGLLMLVVLLFSSLYIAVEADHDCCGEDCPVCSVIRQCENALRGIGDRILVLLSVIIPALFVLLISGILVPVFYRETPVSRKVRLND